MRNSVGIGDFESSLLQIVTVIEQRSTHKEGTLRVDHNPDFVRLDENIPIGRSIHKVHFILQAGTSTSDYRDAKRTMWTPLALQQLRQLRRSASGHFYQSLVSNLIFYFSRWRHGRIWNLLRLKANAGAFHVAISNILNIFE
jgi:hypothetical protein